MTRIGWIVLMLLLTSCGETYHPTKFTIPEDVELAAHFDNGDRIFLKIPTLSGDSLFVFTDTGGGYTAIYSPAIRRMGREQHIVSQEFDGEREKIILARDIIGENYYHPFLNRRTGRKITAPFYFVPGAEDTATHGMEFTDGFFGQFFFLGRAWTFDYPGRRVILRRELNLDLAHANTQKIGLQKDKGGHPLFGHPSITAVVEGQELPFLFDTGATFSLSAEAQSLLRANENIGGSFIAQSVYETWRVEHPDWRTVEGGDVITEGGKAYSFDLIEVPQITLGGNSVGPVWFSVRPDAAWSKYMIRTMDRVVKGAIGGSALRYLVVDIDYPNELVAFRTRRAADRGGE